MKIPKNINICGQQFKISYKKKIEQDEEELLGLCDVNTCTIKLQTGMNDTKKKEVFLHECIHAIDENLRLGLGEKKVNILAIHILSLITNNKLNFNR